MSFVQPDKAPASPLTMTPAQRLQASRARLRSALAAQGSRTPKGPYGMHEGSDRDTFLGVVERVLREVWGRHPLRGAIRVFRLIAGPAVAEQLRPLAASHPCRLVMIAAGAGAALVWLRPWRLLPQAALLSLVIPRRAIWRALMSSGLDALANGERLTQWIDQALAATGTHPPSAPAAGAGTAPPPPTAPEHAVLHPSQPSADGARAA